MDTTLRRLGIGCKIWGDLLLAEASAMFCVSREVRNTGRPFSHLVSSALARPQWSSLFLPVNGLPSISLREWESLTHDCAHALKAPNWSIRTLTIELARIFWKNDVVADGERVSIEYVQSKVVLPFLQCCLACAQVEDLDGPGCRSLQSLVQNPGVCSGGVVLALKGTFAYMKDYVPVPEPGLVGLLFLPHNAWPSPGNITHSSYELKEAFPIECMVEAHSLTFAGLNGMHGKVIGYEDERVCVKFGDGVKAIQPAKLKLLNGGRFVFIRFRAPNTSVNPSKAIIGNSLQDVVARAQAIFGDRIWNVDEFGQLPWTQDNPTTWFKDGGYYRHLHNIRMSPAKGLARRGFRNPRPDRPLLTYLTYQEMREKYQEGGVGLDARWAAAFEVGASHSQGVATSLFLGNICSRLQEESLSDDTHSPEDSCTKSSAAMPDSDSMEAIIVTEDIEHREPAAVLSQSEAAAVCNVQWASFVERSVLSASAGTGEHVFEPQQQQVRVHQHRDDEASEPSCATGMDRNASSAAPKTAPATSYSPQCLLPCTFVQLRSCRAINVAELQAGSELLSGHGQASVRIVRKLPTRDRDIVQIGFASASNTAAYEQIVVTASHALAIHRPSCKRFLPLLASEIRVGDQLRTHTLAVSVLSVTKSTINTQVFEIELHDMSSSLYVSTGSTPVEVYGATFPKLGNNQVKIISFNRFDCFRELLLEGEELESCRRALTGRGFSPDLGIYELGSGKMFVQAGLAESVLAALALRTGPGLKCTDVVVSSEFEPIVKLAVRQATTRKIFVQREEILDLPRDCTRAKRTFLNLSSSSCGDSAVVCSTTDADKCKGKNPRLSVDAGTD